MVTTARNREAHLRANEDRMSEILDETRTTLVADMERVTGGLTRLAAAVAAHGRIDTTMGILEDIVGQAPRLSTDVQALERDHGELPDVLIELRMRSRQLESDIHRVVGRLDQHLRLTQHLVFEAFATDLGDGD